MKNRSRKVVVGRYVSVVCVLSADDKFVGSLAMVNGLGNQQTINSKFVALWLWTLYIEIKYRYFCKV